MSGKAQSWRKSVLTLQLYLMLVKLTVKFILTNMVLKEAGKVILPIFIIQVHYTCIYFHVKMISHYASVNFFLTHTVHTLICGILLCSLLFFCVPHKNSVVLCTKPVLSRLFRKPFNRRQKPFNRTGNQFFFFAVRNFNCHTSEKIAANYRLLKKKINNFVRKKDHKALVVF